MYLAAQLAPPPYENQQDQTMINCVDRQLADCLQAMDIDMWVPRETTLAEAAPDSIAQSDAPVYQSIYQASTPSDWLVLCDRAAVSCWPQARKLLANILYFLNLKPGTYHIAAPASAAENSMTFADVIDQNSIKHIVSFGENLSIDSHNGLRYVYTISLADMLQNPDQKQQALHDLLESGIQKIRYQ